MIINEAGEYTLQYTATDACGNSTTVQRDLVVTPPPIYGVTWNYNNPASQLTRTDASALFSDPQPAVNNGTGSSPFDNIMPWSGMQIVEDAEVGTLVSIPKFYYKWTQESSNRILRISPQPQEGFFVSPAHADRGDGVGERDVVYVGRYHCSDVDYKSNTGVLPKGSMTRADFRTNIHALGSDIWQNDFAMFWTIRMLYLVEYADWNSQAKIGYGCGSGSSKANEGATDAMQYHTGTNAATRDTYGEVQYRHIEGLWSNMYDFVDGIYFNGSNVYCINNPSNFSDNTNGTLIRTRPTRTGVPHNLAVPSASGYEYALFPSYLENSGYTTYLCDDFFTNTNGVILSTGGSFGYKGEQYGLFCLFCNVNSSYVDTNMGSRLMKLPSA